MEDSLQQPYWSLQLSCQGFWPDQRSSVLSQPVGVDQKLHPCAFFSSPQQKGIMTGPPYLHLSFGGSSVSCCGHSQFILRLSPRIQRPNREEESGDGRRPCSAWSHRNPPPGHWTVSLPVCLWLPASTLPGPGEEVSCPLVQYFICSHLPGWPEGLAVHWRPPSASGIQKAGTQVCQSIRD